MTELSSIWSSFENLWNVPAAHQLETGVESSVTAATQTWQRQHGRASMGDLRIAESIARREYPALADEALPKDPDHPDFQAALVSRYDDLERAYHQTESHALGGWADTSADRHFAMQQLLPREDQLVGDLDTPEQRLAVLNMLTQNRRTDGAEEANVACVPTTLLAAAIMGGGKDGLSSVLEGMRVSSNSLPESQRKQIEAELGSFRERMFTTEKDKALTLGDLQSLSRSLYGTLKRLDGKDPEAEWKNGQGVPDRSVERFTNWAPGLKEMMSDHHLKLRTMRPPGELSMAHEVLEMGDGQGGTHLIYDPWARIDGQVVSDLGQIDAYRATF